MKRRNELQGKRVDELREECDERGLKRGGLKADLVERILQDEAKRRRVQLEEQRAEVTRLRGTAAEAEALITQAATAIKEGGMKAHDHWVVWYYVVQSPLGVTQAVLELLRGPEGDHKSAGEAWLRGCGVLRKLIAATSVVATKKCTSWAC